MIKKQHTGVYAIIINKGKILLVKKTRGPYIGLYDLPGGSFEHGETIDVCLRREVLEETGIEVQQYAWFDNYTARVEYEEEKVQHSMHHIGLLYRIGKWKGDRLNDAIQQYDVAGSEFISLTSVDSDKVSPFVNLVIKTLTF